MERNKFFETANLKKLFFKAAIPGALGMLFSALYQLIDGIFVNFYVGETAFAAVNFSFPIVFMLFGISDLIGVGSSVIIAIKHGEGNRKEADEIFSTALFSILMVNIVLGIIFYFSARPLLAALGAEGQLLEYSVQYLEIYAITLPLTGAVFALDNYLRISGFVKYSMAVNIALSLYIVLFDYLFLGVFKMGMIGAPIASCSGCFVMTLISFIPFIFKKTYLRFGKIHFHKEYIFRVFKSGTPNFLSNISYRLSAVIFNVFLLALGGEKAVAVFGVIMYFDSFVQPLMYGMCDAVQPAIGYHYGAKNYKKVRSLNKMCFISSFVLCIISFFIAFFFGGQFSMLFLDYTDTALISLAAHALMVTSFAYLIKWIPYASQSFFNAVEKPLLSTILTLMWGLGFPMLFLPLVYVMDLDGIWINNPLANVLAAILAIGFMVLVYKKYVGKENIVNFEEKEEQKAS